MVQTTQILSKYLLEEFYACTQLRYSGKLAIRSSNEDHWSFYYRFGRIIWATGGMHPSRRWYRQMTQYCPYFDISTIKIRAADLALEHWDYQSIIALHRRDKLDSKQVECIAENVIQEILFDLAQQQQLNQLTCIRDSQIILDLPITFTSTNLFIKRVETQVQDWNHAGFGNCSPDLAPLIQEHLNLQKIVSPAVYKNFVTFINGKYTLRDLSVLLKQDITRITTSLIPHISQGFIQLTQVPDLPLPGTVIINRTIPEKKEKLDNPLIACIDDSSQVCQILEQIIISNGMRFLKIQDAIQALPKIIEHKPDLILLDLIMPVVHGYEICSQIRRISDFTDTPVIILTGSDGLFDRVRAKVVGSTDFLTKPIVADKIIAMVKRHLPKYFAEDIPKPEAKIVESSQFQIQKTSITKHD
ncbi:MAG: response regulator [Calothrix sp. CSU_2_0]|nr:response regulator [Calothrix sp. CSU_2_0]